jgi:hypothetical protein
MRALTPTDENGLGVGACVTVGLVALPEHLDAVFEE